MSSDGAVLALETRSKAVANVAGNGALPSETTLADGSQLRFIFKVVKSLSLVMLLPQDDQEGMDLSTLLALHCPEMAADTTGQEVLHQRGERVMLQTVAVSGDSLEALQGVRCSVHVVNSCLVFLPQVRACRAVLCVRAPFASLSHCHAALQPSPCTAGRVACVPQPWVCGCCDWIARCRRGHAT